MSYAGKDATKEFETSGHSDFAREMAKQFLVGDYSEVINFSSIWEPRFSPSVPSQKIFEPPFFCILESKCVHKFIV